MMPHLAPQSRQHESPEIRPAQVLQEEVEKMIRSGQMPSTTKIKDIENLVSGEIFPELQATHSMAQMDITMMSHAASATNQNTYQELQTTKHTMEVQVMHDRDALSNCRTAEAPLNASKVLHCSVRDGFLQGIELPASLPSQRSPALMGPYLDAMSTYFYPKHGEFVKLDTACINATGLFDMHRSSCNMMQAQYELDFCTWRTRMMDICMLHSHMYAHAVATYRSKEASTKVLVQKMKTEYTAIKKILCYVNVWLSDNNTSTANQTILEACNMSAVDTSPMDISYPGVPCATTCDTSATAAFPGTEAFAAGYANYSQAPATITPCMAEGSAANGMLSLLNERTRKACTFAQDDTKTLGPHGFVVGTRGCAGHWECQFKSIKAAEDFCESETSCTGILLHPDPFGVEYCAMGLGCFTPRQGPPQTDLTWSQAGGQTFVKKCSSDSATPVSTEMPTPPPTQAPTPAPTPAPRPAPTPMPTP